MPRLICPYCPSTFQDQPDYYVHWSRLHKLNLVTGEEQPYVDPQPYHKERAKKPRKGEDDNPLFV